MEHKQYLVDCYDNPDGKPCEKAIECRTNDEYDCPSRCYPDCPACVPAGKPQWTIEKEIDDAIKAGHKMVRGDLGWVCSCECPVCYPKPEQPQEITRNMGTPESRKFWADAEKAKAEVDTWPEWKRNIIVSKYSKPEQPDRIKQAMAELNKPSGLPKDWRGRNIGTPVPEQPQIDPIKDGDTFTVHSSLTIDGTDEDNPIFHSKIHSIKVEQPTLPAELPLKYKEEKIGALSYTTAVSGEEQRDADQKLYQQVIQQRDELSNRLIEIKIDLEKAVSDFIGTLKERDEARRMMLTKDEVEHAYHKMFIEGDTCCTCCLGLKAKLKAIGEQI